MGVKRWLSHMNRYTAARDLVVNMVNEGGVVKGVKKSIKQEFCEDNPLTTAIYKAGKSDGKVEGYAEASDEYEDKLIKQGDLFLQEKKDLMKERDEFIELLDEYDKKIQELQEKNDKSEAEIRLLQMLLLKERELKRLGGM